MPFAKILAILRTGLSAISKLVPMKRRLTAERRAGQEPFSAREDRADQLLDQALLRLGLIKADDPQWKKLVQGLGAAVTRPELFEKPHIREWLTMYDVGASLKGMVKARVTGGPIDKEAHKLLVATYMDRSGEDQRHAEGVIDTALAFLQASLQSAATDAGTSGLLQSGFQGVHKRFDGLEERVSELGAQTGFNADGVVAEHHGADAKKELENILRRRSTPQHDTLAELQELASHLGEKGKYRDALTSIKADVFSWVARVAANKGDIEKAESALRKSKGCGMQDTAIIDAWLDVARGDVSAAMRRLRSRQDADSRSNLFAILWQKQNDRSALEFFDSLGQHSIDQFTALGWRNVVACLIGTNRIQDVLDILVSLPQSMVSECPNLGYLQGVVYSTKLVPEAYRHRMLDEQYLAVTDHLLEGAEADHWRGITTEAFNWAKLAAEGAQDMFLPTMADQWLRWLRLIDPERHKDELAVLKIGMENGASAVGLIDFAEAFNLAFDPVPLEKYLIRAEGLGGLSREQLYAKLILLKRTGRFEELERFIETNWERLVKEVKAGAIAGFLIEALISYGNWRRAEEVLAERQDLFIESDIPRYRLMIDHCRGDDPTKRALENYEETGSIEDLWNLVYGLQRANRWTDLAPFARRLFDTEPTTENALRYVHCLYKTETSEEEVLAFLTNNSEIVKRSLELESAMAWSLFHLGQVEESRKINDKLLATRHHVNDIGLDINIAMRVGEWERFTEILGREWDRRNELPISLLLQLAKLAGARAPERAIQLAQEAVERDSNNPYVLLQASGIATALAHDEIGMPWIHQAAIASRDGQGPVHLYSFREALELMKNNADDWRRKNDLFNSGEIPLHWAAPMFNMPMSRFLVASPRENMEQADTRKRYSIPVCSGARRAIETVGINRIALDITSIFVLSGLNLLDVLIDSLDGTYVSPRVMELLLLEREKVEFHQPSRIRAAKPLLELRIADKLIVTAVKGTTTLIAEVGEEIAALLESAKQEHGFCVHAGKLYKVGSFMDEAAYLGDLTPLLVNPAAVAVTLHEEGHIGTTAFQKTRAFLSSVGGEYNGSALTRGAPIYLDCVSAQYLSEVNLLTALINSGRKVFIHPSAIEEWEALVTTERHTATMVDALEAMRHSLRKGMIAKKVHLLREGRKDDLDDPNFRLTVLPIIDLLEDLGQVDAVCIDDRFLNAHPFITDKDGRRLAIMCTLDVLALLENRKRIRREESYHAIHTMRQWGLFALPIETNELYYLLLARPMDDNGDIKESAELRAIRENLSRVHSINVLTTAADLQYLDHLWRVGYETIRKLWRVESMPIDLLMSRANWIIDHVMPNIELALRFASYKNDRLESLATSRILAFLLPGLAAERRQEYAEWLETKVVSDYLPANSKILELAAAEIARWVITSSREVANEIRKSDRMADITEPTENNS